MFSSNKFNEGQANSRKDFSRHSQCGACIPTCPTEAIQLCKKEKEIIPPKDWDSLYAEILNKK